MRAGELRRKVTIQNATITQDSYGAKIETWGTFVAVWASIEPIHGREFFESAKLNANITHRIKTRYAAGVTPDMRVLYGTRLFDIQSIINRDERNRELELMCMEIIK